MISSQSGPLAEQWLQLQSFILNIKGQDCIVSSPGIPHE